MKKFICVLLSVLFSSLCFFGCNDSTGNDDTPPTPPPSDEEEVEEEILDIDEGGIEIGDLTPAYVFTNNMVLQRNKEVKVYGAGGYPRLDVTVEFNGQVKSARPDKNGIWCVTLDPMSANSVGQQLKIYDDAHDPIVYENVLVGEVWYCSGQSNMEMHLGLALSDRGFSTSGNYENSPLADYTKYTNWNKIRFYKQKNYESTKPHRLGGIHPTYDTGWGTPTTMKDAMNYSAYATGFALRLQQELNVPVGIIVSAVSGSSIVQWLAKETFEKNNLYLHYSNDRFGTSEYYNGMTFALNDFAVAGLLWYQGCTDSYDHYVDYWHEDMKAFCAQFRKAHGNVPIISQMLVQHCFGANWSLIRQASIDLMNEVDNFYAVNGIDAGIPYDNPQPSTNNRIHPADKYGISKDAAEIALTKVYNMTGYNSVAEYPVSIQTQGNNLLIYYRNGVELKLSSGTNVNNLEGYNPTTKEWEVITNATVNANIVTVLNGSNYTKVRYANYNVMMAGATDKTILANVTFNSESIINLYSQKDGCDDLAVFPFREIEVNK